MKTFIQLWNKHIYMILARVIFNPSSLVFFILYESVLGGETVWDFSVSLTMSCMVCKTSRVLSRSSDAWHINLATDLKLSLSDRIFIIFSSAVIVWFSKMLVGKKLSRNSWNWGHLMRKCASSSTSFTPKAWQNWHAVS